MLFWTFDVLFLTFDEVIFNVLTLSQWIEVQRLREEGIKELAVAGPLNFIPWILFLLPKLKRTMDWIVEVNFQ
jgi:hypothetical protein